jgi:diguanylate cyclase (GGDEF)-like protein
MDPSRNIPVALPELPQGLRRSPRSTWRLASCVLVLLSMFPCAFADSGDDAEQLLKQADAAKLADYGQFSQLLQSLQARSARLTPAQRESLDYLQGWNSAYKGDYPGGVARLRKLADSAHDLTVRFRATTTIINLLTLARRYEEAFSSLNRLLEMLAQISDGDAREQALQVAAYTYVEVGQYDLTLRYAQMLIDDNWAGRGECKGGELRLEGLYRSGRLTTDTPLRAGIATCEHLAGGMMFAAAIRTFAAQFYIGQQRYDEAIAVLRERYDEVLRSQYGRLISGYDSLLSQAYQGKGQQALAQQFALDSVRTAVAKEYSEPLVNAYATLYELAKARGDYKSALGYHEQYALADKAYLDDVSARHLAYQKITHENLANKLQVDALNRENRVLQLQRQLTAKAVEASRLYIALLGLCVVFIGFWAYRTKRSQLHFMTLSRLDGLTGICNRPHFMAQAQKALDQSREGSGAAATGKAREDTCIVLCDLDHFKAINDKHGHATGDYVLRRVVSACKPHLRPNDVFGRFGGEEFGFLFPACEPAEARRRSEEMRQAIASITTKQDAMELTVSASFGIASSNTCGFQLRELLAHADAALYEAKRTGRNCVVLHEERPVASCAAAAKGTLELPEGKRIPEGSAENGVSPIAG